MPALKKHVAGNTSAQDSVVAGVPSLNPFAQKFTDQGTKTASYSMTAWDSVKFDCTSAPISQALPSVVSGTSVYVFNSTALGGNSLTLSGSGGPFTLVPNHGAVYFYTGSTWEVHESRWPITALRTEFAMANPTLSVTYNSDGTVASTTENGIVTSFTYNSDGSVHTETRNGVLRTFAYNADGTVSGAS